MAADIGVKVAVEGYSKFKTEIQDITQQQKTLKSEMNAVTSAWDKNTSAEKKNAETKRILNEQIKAQEQKVQELQKVLTEVEKKYGENSREANSWREKLNNATADLNKMNAELKSLPSGIDLFGQRIQEAGGKVTAFGEGLKGVGEGLTKAVTVPLAAVGAASVAAFTEYDKGADTIIAKTGATGDALKEMQGIMEGLATSIPTDFETAGAAVGEVNTRFGLMGDELQNVSSAFLQFAQLNGTDVSGSIDKVQASMTAFGMTSAEATTALDILNKAGQDTGISVDKLSSDLMSNSTILKEMGFSYNEAAGFIANLNKNGIDSSTVMAGMKKAMQNATKEGKPLKQALKELEAELKTANSNTEAMQKATELFGAKAAPQLVAALQEGRISLDEAANAVQNYGDSVSNTFEATLSPTDKMKTTLNEVKIVGAELGSTLLEMAVPALQKLSEIVTAAKTAWDGLTPAQQETIVKMGLIAAAIGPVVTIIGGLITGIGGLITTFGTLIPIIASGAAAFGAVVAAAAPFIAIGAAVVAAGVLIYKNWDTIKEKAGELAQTVSQKFDEIKQSATEKWNAANEAVNSAMGKIKETVSTGMSIAKDKASEYLSMLVSEYEKSGGGMSGAIQAAMTTAKAAFDEAYAYIDQVTNGRLSALVETVSGILTKVKDAFFQKLEEAKKVVTDAVDFLKGAFNFEWKLPEIKLPHFSISGNFSLNPPSVPSFSIDWYAKAMDNGMILNAPTIFGMQNGQFLGAGEAGAEVVVGAGSLSRMIQNAVNTTYNTGGNTINVYGAPGQDVTELAHEVADIINGEVQMRGAVWA